MLLITYPIEGAHRFPQMIMEFIFMIACIELGIIFYIRYLKQDKSLRNLQDLGYGVLLFSFGLMVLWFLIADYFAPDYSVRLVYLNLGYFSTMIGAFLFIFTMERYKKFLFMRYFFSIGFFIMISIFVIALFIDVESSRILSRMFWPLFLFFLFIYLIDFSKRVQNREKIIVGLLKFLPGFALLVIGFAFTTDVLEEVIGVNLRFYGALMELIAIFLLSFFFITLPPFSEFEWEQKMEHILVMDFGGICLYDEALNNDSDLIDQNLVAGAISSINILLEELTSDKGVVVINKKGKSIILYPGKQVYGVMFCTEEMNYIKVLLKKFIDKFEAVYGKILEKWDGEVTIFQSTKTIVNEIFHPD